MGACLLAFLAGSCVYASLRLASSCAALHTARINHALRSIAAAVHRRGVRFECEPHVSRTEYSYQRASINYALDVHCCCRPSTRCSFRMRVSCATHSVPWEVELCGADCTLLKLVFRQIWRQLACIDAFRSFFRLPARTPAVRN